MGHPVALTGTRRTDPQGSGEGEEVARAELRLELPAGRGTDLTPTADRWERDIHMAPTEVELKNDATGRRAHERAVTTADRGRVMEGLLWIGVTASQGATAPCPLSRAPLGLLLVDTRQCCPFVRFASGGRASSPAASSAPRSMLARSSPSSVGVSR